VEGTKPSNDSICPMCGQVPEDFGIKNHESYVWNALTDCFICEFCDVELAIEFYEDDSRYFQMAADFLGLDVWECKKRYLEYVIKTSETTLAESGEEDTDDVELLHDRIRNCNTQAQAIEQFLEAKRNVTSQQELDAELDKVREALSVPAFDIDAVIPNLITIEFV